MVSLCCFLLQGDGDKLKEIKQQFAPWFESPPETLEEARARGEAAMNAVRELNLLRIHAENDLNMDLVLQIERAQRWLNMRLLHSNNLQVCQLIIKSHRLNRAFDEHIRRSNNARERHVREARRHR